MTLFHLHDEFAAENGESRLTLARAWVVAGLKMIHEAIVIARMRRLQRELTFHADPGEESFGGQDIRKTPRRPMVLGDKWDF